MINRRIAAAVGVLVLGSVAVPAVGTGAASAAAGTLYVNNTVSCSDGAGAGTQALPFCHVAAAAAVVNAGQTVQIADGDYNETGLTLTRSGTAAAPITFRGAAVENSIGGSRIHGDFDSAHPGNGLVVAGAEHVVVENLTVTASYGKKALLVDHGNDVRFRGINFWGANAQVTNGSTDVTVAGSRLEGKGPLVLVDGGSQNTVVSTNTVTGNNVDDMTGIQVTDAPGTVVVSNTVRSFCFPGIVLGGASTGATIENNVVETQTSYGPPACATPARATGITVAATATSGTKLDYNLVSPLSGGTAYNWGGAAYTTQPALTAGTGQGAHEIVADSDWLWQREPGNRPSPIIDSADENAPGMIDSDAYGWPAVDHPTVPNTGTGRGIRDRGAQEYMDFGSLFTPAGPTRLLDTRAHIGVGGTTPVAAWGTVTLPVTGIAGVPASGVTAVTLNVTVTDPREDGHLTVYPHGGDRPNSSNLNWTAGKTIPNLVTVPVVDGKVSFYNASGGTVHVIADLAGYYSGKGSVLTSTSPTRLLDTRAHIGVGGTTPVAAWGTVTLPVTGIAGVPASGVTAVTLNVTVTDPREDGHLTVYPHGGAAPNASNLNWPAGKTIPNLVTVPVVDGKVSFYNASGGTVHVIADLAGYYSANGYETYRPVGPWRVMDTREDWGAGSGTNTRKAGPVPARGTLDVYLDMPVTDSVTLNVTVTEPGTDGHLTVYPYGGTVPNASNLNWVKGETIPNQVVVKVKEGKVSFYNASDAPVHLVVDAFGYNSR
ncbi:right-handed parallel beta-helix repeat-containing protein [Kitasatospora cineracea]|uniref:Parallel beta helix pectate lyase-like protein n=1 Tax=Kitasatospora cineracea TaxID=88074 RepID=A0A3N4RGJ7_9ACTN|nr:right-handed parallel beta-helix repeat-containing protein [Kitasatospora cineracea]RPE32528.1 parallel beta helix pectate lyase-like protein [Kitasatospora cineracea]